MNTFAAVAGGGQCRHALSLLLPQQPFLWPSSLTPGDLGNNFPWHSFGPMLSSIGHPMGL
jgi:hypothetical protein